MIHAPTAFQLWPSGVQVFQCKNSLQELKLLHQLYILKTIISTATIFNGIRTGFLSVHFSHFPPFQPFSRTGSPSSEPVSCQPGNLTEVTTTRFNSSANALPLHSERHIFIPVSTFTNSHNSKIIQQPLTEVERPCFLSIKKGILFFKEKG